MDELLDRSEVAEAAFRAYIQERAGTYYLADTERWSVRDNIWTRKYWLGYRDRMNVVDRVFFIEFQQGTNTIARQWQE